MTNAQMIQGEDSTKNNRLYIAFELSNSKWKLMFGNRVKKRQKTIEARDLKALEEEITKAQKRFNMDGEVKIYSCYEAGRDGFWLHRYLVGRGIENCIVDSSSIEVNRRYRRVKTDQVDANKLSLLVPSELCTPAPLTAGVERLLSGSANFRFGSTRAIHTLVFRDAITHPTLSPAARFSGRC